MGKRKSEVEKFMKVWLDVPIESIGMAKSAGARFDMSKKRWYVPDGLDAMEFVQWLPQEWRDYGARLDAIQKRRA